MNDLEKVADYLRRINGAGSRLAKHLGEGQPHSDMVATVTGLSSLALERLADCREARAAVAELIAALGRALPTVEHMYHTSPDEDGSLWADVIACRTALARVGVA